MPIFALRLRGWRTYTLTALFAFSTSIVMGWTGDAIKGETLFCAWTGWTEAECRGHGMHLWALFACALATTGLLLAGRRLLSHLGTVDELEEVPPKPVQTLLVLVSTPNHARLDCNAGTLTVHSSAGAWRLEWLAGTDPAGVLDSWTAAHAAWNWLPLLRAVWTHQDGLHAVVLLGSRESAAGLPECRRVLEHMWAGSARSHRPPKMRLSTHEPDFSSLCAVRDAIRHELALAGDTTLAVDVTGGTKTASIAAAVAAMDAGAVLQYIEGPRVRTYRIAARRWQAF